LPLGRFLVLNSVAMCILMKPVKHMLHPSKSGILYVNSPQVL
jgi:hypothetical protein